MEGELAKDLVTRGEPVDGKVMIELGVEVYLNTALGGAQGLLFDCVAMPKRHRDELKG
jgi:hypothetical protein